MIIFVDSANIDEIASIAKYSIIDGVTTNPSLIAKSGKDIKKTIAEICGIIKGDVSAELCAEDYDNMVSEGKELYSIAPNVVLKLPLTIDGLRACKYFSGQGKKTNVTLCFSAQQALLAAKAGATYISPFIGRLEDVNENGLELIRQIKTIFFNYPNLTSKILAASIRNSQHVLDCALIGADAITMPAKIITELFHHDLTVKGLEIFRQDANTRFHF